MGFTQQRRIAVRSPAAVARHQSSQVYDTNGPPRVERPPGPPPSNGFCVILRFNSHEFVGGSYTSTGPALILQTNRRLARKSLPQSADVEHPAPQLGQFNMLPSLPHPLGIAAEVLLPIFRRLSRITETLMNRRVSVIGDFQSLVHGTALALRQ